MKGVSFLLRLQGGIVFCALVLIVFAGRTWGEDAGTFSAEELVERIIASEGKIHDAQAEYVFFEPETNVPLYYAEWGYEAGKEFIAGIWFEPAGDNQGYKSSHKAKHALDENRTYYYFRDESESGRTEGSVKALSIGVSDLFRANMTPNSLLGFDVTCGIRQSFGAALKSARRLSVRKEPEEIDAHPCSVLEAVGIADAEFVWDVRAWIDTSRDFRPLKVEIYYSDEDMRFIRIFRRLYDIKLERIGGISFPIEGKRDTFTGKRGHPQYQVLAVPTRMLKADIGSVRINQGIEAEQFKVKFPPGCQVWDEVRKTQYTIERHAGGDVKGPVSIELSALKRFAPPELMQIIYPDTLVGGKLAELADLGVKVDPDELEDRMVLVCFFDMNQRPSRHCVRELARRARELGEKGVTVLLVQASPVESDAFAAWTKKYAVPFRVGTVTGGEWEVRLRWGVKALPWLVLADRQHIVAAEGFGFDELDEKIKMTGSGSSADDVGAKVGQIRGSFLRQRSLFHNARFKGCYIQPYSRVEESGPGQPKIVEIAGKKRIVEQEYQLNRDGRFVLTTIWFVSDEKTGERERESGMNRISFDGQVYHSESRPVSDVPGAGSIFTPEHPFDYSKPMVKPTFFMDHVFNDDVLEVLEDREDINIETTVEGKWHLKYRDPASDRFYDLDLDPEQDFMITKMRGYWTAFQRFEKKMEYGKTDEGFYYLKKGTLSVGGGEPTVMVVRQFSLNGPEGNYRVEFPPGTRVTDHRNGRREFYAGESEPTRLVGKALPGFEDMSIDFDPARVEDKAMLICFFDMNQRPSRHCVRQVAKRAKYLEGKGVLVAAVQASKVDQEVLDEWVRKYNVPFTVGMIGSDEKRTRFNWGVKSLPWLILTDREHIVRFEGLSLEELDEKLEQLAPKPAKGRSDYKPIEVGQMAPDFELPRLTIETDKKGKPIGKISADTVKLSSFRGKLPVFLIFSSYT